MVGCAPAAAGDAFQVAGGNDEACERPPLNIGAPVAQLDRVPGYEPGGREFESLRARQ